MKSNKIEKNLITQDDHRILVETRIIVEALGVTAKSEQLKKITNNLAKNLRNLMEFLEII